MNPGNMIMGPTAARHGGVVGDGFADKAHKLPFARFPTPAAGFAAMRESLDRKYESGKTTTEKLIVGKGNWTPTPDGPAHSERVARAAGLEGPKVDMQLKDPDRMRGIQIALAKNEGAPKMVQAMQKEIMQGLLPSRAPEVGDARARLLGGRRQIGANILFHEE